MTTQLTVDEALANAVGRHALSRPGSSVEQVAASLVGLHNTSQPSPYLSVRARVTGFVRGDLETLMWDEWRLARLRAMRLTMFVMPHDLLEITAAATRHFAEPFAARWLRDSGLALAEFERLAAAVEEALADGPMTSRQLRAALDVPQSVGLPGVVGRMCDIGRIVGGRPPNHWRSNIREYHLWADVLPGVDLHRWQADAAIGELIHRYVDSYGPVTVDDVAWWTGIAKSRCRAALRAINAQEVTVEGWPGPLYRTTHADTELGDAVHALPILDPYVQGYRDRGRFLDPARTGFVYDRGGNSTATIVHRGRIVGVWQVSEDPAPSVRYHLFPGAPASVRAVAEADLAAAGELYWDQPVDVIDVPEMVALDAGGGRSATHPLDDRIHRASRKTTS